MSLVRINALRDLSYSQLVNLAIQRKIVIDDWRRAREWSPDRLRLKLIDSIVEEELREQRMDEAQGQGRR